MRYHRLVLSLSQLMSRCPCRGPQCFVSKQERYLSTKAEPRDLMNTSHFLQRGELPVSGGVQTEAAPRPHVAGKDSRSRIGKGQGWAG